MNRRLLISNCIALFSLIVSPARGNPSPVCVPDSNISLCVQFDNLPTTPSQGTDFDVTFDTNHVPSVDLKIGRNGQGTLYQWRVWCKDTNNSDAPANIGTISGTTNYDFDVKVLNDSDGTGAATVGTINLHPNTGKYSRLAGGIISGDLTGDLFLQQASGSGGDLAEFTIQGDVASTSTLTVPVVGALTVSGEFAGQLVLAGGVPDGAGVGIGGALTGTIDLTEDDLAGAINFHGGDGRLINVGAFKDTAALAFAESLETFSGELHFQTTEPSISGVGITSEGGFLNGLISIEGDMDGEIGCHAGAFLSGAVVSVGGNLEGSVYTSYGVMTGQTGNMEGRISVDGDLSGTIGIGDIGLGSLLGDILIVGDVSSTGLVLVEDHVTDTGRVLIDGSCDGAVSVGSVSDGIITVGGDLGGSITITDTVSGTIYVDGNLDSGGLIQLVDGMKDNAYIGVGGVSSGTIKVQQQMTDLSAIKVAGGLDTGSLVTVNTNGGSSSVTEGTIWIGGRIAALPFTIPFAGAVHLNCGSSSADFAGVVKIVGCAASSGLRMCSTTARPAARQPSTVAAVRTRTQLTRLEVVRKTHEAHRIFNSMKRPRVIRQPRALRINMPPADCQRYLADMTADGNEDGQDIAPFIAALKM